MIDVINQVDRKVVPFIRDNPKLDLVRSPGAVHWTFICAADKEPTSNNHIRQALMYGCDRQAMLDLVMGGLGSLAFGYPFLTSGYVELSLPVIGKLSLASALVFDIGVYMVVFAGALLMLSTMGTVKQRTPRGAG